MTIYMKIDGIDGDISSQGFEKWINVISFDFEVKRKLNTQPGRIMDREGTRPSISEFSLTKKMDKTSPLLFSEACTGSAKPQVKLVVTTTNDKLTTYMEYTLSNVIISAYTVSENPLITTDAEGLVDSHYDYPTETLSLNFDKIEMKYTPFDEKHKAQSPIPAGYDLKAAGLI